jgi:hypothetical protein
LTQVRIRHEKPAGLTFEALRAKTAIVLSLDNALTAADWTLNTQVLKLVKPVFANFTNQVRAAVKLFSALLTVFGAVMAELITHTHILVA